MARTLAEVQIKTIDKKEIKYTKMSISLSEIGTK